MANRRPKIYWPRVPGIRSGARKLTRKQIKAIAGSDLPGNVLAERYGVSAARISQIRKGRVWKTAAWWIEGRQANDNGPPPRYLRYV